MTLCIETKEIGHFPMRDNHEVFVKLGKSPSGYFKKKKTLALNTNN
jgi:hypothetical protein